MRNHVKALKAYTNRAVAAAAIAEANAKAAASAAAAQEAAREALQDEQRRKAGRQKQEKKGQCRQRNNSTHRGSKHARQASFLSANDATSRTPRGQ